MKEHFRQSMAWWHTWVGLVCGWLIFAIFFTGTTAVFRGAGQHWLTPELHLPAAKTRLDAREMVEAAERLLRAQGDSRVWMVGLPKQDEPYFDVFWLLSPRPGLAEEDMRQSRRLDVATGEALAAQPRVSGAMHMLFSFHFCLLSRFGLGLWLVGAMAVAMLVLLVSGVVVHKKIFTDFFTFRPDKAPARSWLDAHNVSSVMTLPFALMITYTGLVIFCFDWMPAGVKVVGREAMRDEARPVLQSADAPGEAPTLPLWSFVERAEAGQTLNFMQVFDPGKTQAQVRILPHGDNSVVWSNGNSKTFNGATGELLHQETEARTASATQEVMRSLHEIRFAGPVLRWLYFLMSAGCCVMIATGLVLWTVKRRHKALKQTTSVATTTAGSIRGWRVVEALNVGTVAGLLIATAAMFWSNRLIPASLPGREDWEIRVFFIVWAVCGLWALVRARHLRVAQAPSAEKTGISPRRLWAEQLWLAAGLYGLIPLVNAITTPNSALWVTIPTGQVAVAGFDLTMLGAGVLLALGARKVGRAGIAPARDAARVTGDGVDHVVAGAAHSAAADVANNAANPIGDTGEAVV